MRDPRHVCTPLQHRNRQMRVELESIRSVKDPSSHDPSERSRTREERAGGGGHWFIGSYVPVRLPRTSVSNTPPKTGANFVLADVHMQV